MIRRDREDTDFKKKKKEIMGKIMLSYGKNKSQMSNKGADGCSSPSYLTMIKNMKVIL